MSYQDVVRFQVERDRIDGSSHSPSLRSNPPQSIGELEVALRNPPSDDPFAVGNYVHLMRFVQTPHNAELILGISPALYEETLKPARDAIKAKQLNVEQRIAGCTPKLYFGLQPVTSDQFTKPSYRIIIINENATEDGAVKDISVTITPSYNQGGIEKKLAPLEVQVQTETRGFSYCSPPFELDLAGPNRANRISLHVQASNPNLANPIEYKKVFDILSTLDVSLGILDVSTEVVPHNPSS